MIICEYNDYIHDMFYLSKNKKKLGIHHTMFFFLLPSWIEMVKA